MFEFNEFDLRTYPRAASRRERFEPRAAKGGSSAPQAPSYYSQITGELAGKAQLAPLVYGTEATYDPLYAGLNNQLLNTTMFGSPGGTVPMPGISGVSVDGGGNVTLNGTPMLTYGTGTTAAPGISSAGNGWNNTNRTGQSALMRSLGVPNGGYNRGNLQPNQPAPVAPTLNLPSSPGLLGMASQIGTTQRQGNISDWSNLSPLALAAIKASNPQLAGLIDQMMTQSGNELNLGSNLDPAMMRQMQQTVRARQAGMLGGTGNAGDYGEALALGTFGENLRQQRFQNAGTAAGISGSYYTPQLNNLMTQTYNPYGALQFGAAQNSGIGPRLFGSDINAQQAYNQQYQGQLSAYNSQQNNNAALTSAGISGGVGLASAGLLAMALA